MSCTRPLHENHSVSPVDRANGRLNRGADAFGLVLKSARAMAEGDAVRRGADVDARTRVVAVADHAATRASFDCIKSQLNQRSTYSIPTLVR